MPSKDKVALVTGGSRGIGLGIAECLVTDGFDLAINGVRAESDVTDTLEKLRGSGQRVIYVQGDVSKAADRTHIVDAVEQWFGRLDVLVNNAGVAPKVRADILEADEASFERLININLKGPYFLTQAVARWMIEQRKAEPRESAAGELWGCIINVSSVSATVVSTNRGDYCISKAGIAMASKLWAARLAEFGIGVYEVRPGVIRTDMTSAVTAKYDKLFSEGLALQKRWGEPKDIGKAVAALARGDFAYSTGDVFMIDGGMTVQQL